MAYLRDKEMIFNKMATNKLSFYKVLDSDGKTVLDSQDDEDCTVNEAQNRLRDTLENLQGLVTIVLSNKSPKQKGTGGNTQGDLRFSIKLTDGDSKSINGHNDLRIDELRASIAREYEAKIEALIAKHESEKKLEKLQQQIDELKSGNDLDKYMPMIAGLLQQGGALAGHPDNGPHITGPGEAKERITIALNRLLKSDKNFIDHLELLADLAEKSPLVYSLAVQKLKSST